VFAAAGACGLGALSAAGIRGVWGIGADADRSYLGPHILASTVKRYDRAVLLAIRGFIQGTLPAGKDVEMGLDDEAVGITGISAEVPAAIRQKLTRVAAALRAREHQTP
jgi:basic membrane protein A and related proteins